MGLSDLFDSEYQTPISKHEYWMWVCVTLYILLAVDLLTTIYASSIHGAGAEANPYIRWALQEGVHMVVGINIAALISSALLFKLYFKLLSSTVGIEAWLLTKMFELWIGFLLTAGLFVFVNNMSVIIYSQSIL